MNPNLLAKQRRPLAKTAKWAVLLLILLAWGCNSDADQEQVEISIPVSAEKVAKGSIEAYVLTSGTLQAYHTAILYAEAQGRYRSKYDSSPFISCIWINGRFNGVVQRQAGHHPKGFQSPGVC